LFVGAKKDFSSSRLRLPFFSSSSSTDLGRFGSR
jgi:hypothetical protein